MHGWFKCHWINLFPFNESYVNHWIRQPWLNLSFRYFHSIAIFIIMKWNFWACTGWITTHQYLSWNHRLKFEYTVWMCRGSHIYIYARAYVCVIQWLWSSWTPQHKWGENYQHMWWKLLAQGRTLGRKVRVGCLTAELFLYSHVLFFH